MTKFPGLLFLLDLDRPSTMRALTIPPRLLAARALLSAHEQALVLDRIDILSPIGAESLVKAGGTQPEPSGHARTNRLCRSVEAAIIVPSGLKLTS